MLNRPAPKDYTSLHIQHAVDTTWTNQAHDDL